MKKQRWRKTKKKSVRCCYCNEVVKDPWSFIGCEETFCSIECLEGDLFSGF